MLFAGVAVSAARAPTLDIYYVDTEGGQATLFVSPEKQTVLVDTGFAGTRDAERIAQVLQAASASRIDYLIVTHYHGDHVGGFAELARRIPIINLVDHGPSVETTPPTPSKLAYDAAASKGSHIVAGVGYKLPIRGLDWTIVSSAGKVLATDIPGAPGAGTPNPYCAGFRQKDIQTGPENGQSVGSLIEYGKFRTIDLGDLLWNKEAELMCPTNHIGTIDLLLTSHHGMSWSGSQVLVHGLRPRVAVMNNGVSKGGEVEAFEMLETSPGLEDLWQLHWSANGLLEHNVAGRFIANVESSKTTADIIADPPAPIVSATGPAPGPGGPPGGAQRPPPLGNPEHSPAYWIKVSAGPDGSFSVTNSRNGFTKNYQRRD